MPHRAVCKCRSSHCSTPGREGKSCGRRERHLHQVRRTARCRILQVGRRFRSFRCSSTRPARIGCFHTARQLARCRTPVCTPALAGRSGCNSHYSNTHLVRKPPRCTGPLCRDRLNRAHQMVRRYHRSSGNTWCLRCRASRHRGCSRRERKSRSNPRHPHSGHIRRPGYPRT
jgi:hypothetical protein